MVEESIVEKIKKYLQVLPGYGIHAGKVVLYGSFAKGLAHQWSDIDLIVIAPEFDNQKDGELVNTLWRAAL